MDGADGALVDDTVNLHGELDHALAADGIDGHALDGNHKGDSLLQGLDGSNNEQQNMEKQKSYLRSTRVTGYLDLLRNDERRPPHLVPGFMGRALPQIPRITQTSPRSGATALERLSALRQSSPRPVLSPSRGNSQSPWGGSIRLDSRQSIRAYSRQMVQYDWIRTISSPAYVSQASPAGVHLQSRLMQPSISNSIPMAAPRSTRASTAVQTAHTFCRPVGHPAVLVTVSHSPRGTTRSMLPSPRHIS